MAAADRFATFLEVFSNFSMIFSRDFGAAAEELDSSGACIFSNSNNFNSFNSSSVLDNFFNEDFFVFDGDFFLVDFFRSALSDIPIHSSEI